MSLRKLYIERKQVYYDLMQSHYANLPIVNTIQCQQPNIPVHNHTEPHNHNPTYSINPFPSSSKCYSNYWLAASSSPVTLLRLYSPLIFHNVSINSLLICSSCSIEHPLDPSTSRVNISSTNCSSMMISF